MSTPSELENLPRPPSPWPGSEHRALHRWQVDGTGGLPDAARTIRALAAELTAAHVAGWWLQEPMRGGHLLAARASRRQRAHQSPSSPPPTAGSTRVAPVWRLRLADDVPAAGAAVLDLSEATATPAVGWTEQSLVQVSGPQLDPAVLREMARQVLTADLGGRRWAVAPARVGRGYDLVAEGSALRGHAVEDGVLVRTVEVLTFQHAADGATTLLDAAAAYDDFAAQAEAMAAAGGRLATADDGFLHVEYDRLVPR